MLKKNISAFLLGINEETTMKPYNIRNIIPAGTVMSTNITSKAIETYNSFSFGIQIFFTGTSPAGSFKLQSSCDPAYAGLPSSAGSGLNVDAINWTDVANSTFTISAAGNVEWNYDSPGYLRHG